MSNQNFCIGGHLDAHHIVSIVRSEIADPVMKIVIKRYQAICDRCGMPLEEITAQPKRTRSPRKAKPDSQVSPPPTESNQNEATV